jgi:hypothetical protein
MRRSDVRSKKRHQIIFLPSGSPAFACADADAYMREQKHREIEGIADTIRQIITPGMNPKVLIEMVKKRHPNALKKEIAGVALLSVILPAEFDPEDTQALHDLAMKTRDTTDE